MYVSSTKTSIIIGFSIVFLYHNIQVILEDLHISLVYRYNRSISTDPSIELKQPKSSDFVNMSFFLLKVTSKSCPRPFAS